MNRRAFLFGAVGLGAAAAIAEPAPLLAVRGAFGRVGWMERGGYPIIGCVPPFTVVELAPGAMVFLGAEVMWVTKTAGWGAAQDSSSDAKPAGSLTRGT